MCTVVLTNFCYFLWVNLIIRLKDKWNFTYTKWLKYFDWMCYFTGPFQDPMFAVCCPSIVGCKICVLQWHESSTQCLKCRQECTNVYEVTGLSDALSVLKDIISVDWTIWFTTLVPLSIEIVKKNVRAAFAGCLSAVQWILIVHCVHVLNRYNSDWLQQFLLHASH